METNIEEELDILKLLEDGRAALEEDKKKPAPPPPTPEILERREKVMHDAVAKYHIMNKICAYSENLFKIEGVQKFITQFGDQEVLKDWCTKMAAMLPGGDFSALNEEEIIACRTHDVKTLKDSIQEEKRDVRYFNPMTAENLIKDISYTKIVLDSLKIDNIRLNTSWGTNKHINMKTLRTMYDTMAPIMAQVNTRSSINYRVNTWNDIVLRLTMIASQFLNITFTPTAKKKYTARRTDANIKSIIRVSGPKDGYIVNDDVYFGYNVEQVISDLGFVIENYGPQFDHELKSGQENEWLYSFFHNYYVESIDKGPMKKYQELFESWNESSDIDAWLAKEYFGPASVRRKKAFASYVTGVEQGEDLVWSDIESVRTDSKSLNVSSSAARIMEKSIAGIPGYGLPINYRDEYAFLTIFGGLKKKYPEYGVAYWNDRESMVGGIVLELREMLRREDVPPDIKDHMKVFGAGEVYHVSTQNRAAYGKYMTVREAKSFIDKDKTAKIIHLVANPIMLGGDNSINRALTGLARVTGHDSSHIYVIKHTMGPTKTYETWNRLAYEQGYNMQIAKHPFPADEDAYLILTPHGDKRGFDEVYSSSEGRKKKYTLMWDIFNVHFDNLWGQKIRNYRLATGRLGDFPRPDCGDSGYFLFKEEFQCLVWQYANRMKSQNKLEDEKPSYLASYSRSKDTARDKSGKGEEVPAPPSPTETTDVTMKEASREREEFEKVIAQLSHAESLVEHVTGNSMKDFIADIVGVIPSTKALLDLFPESGGDWIGSLEKLGSLANIRSFLTTGEGGSKKHKTV